MKKNITKVLIIIFIILIIFILEGYFLEPNFLKVNEFAINTTSISKNFDNFKIIHFSDVLYNGNNKNIEKVISKINEQSPDIIIFTGNLINKNYKINEQEENYLIEQLNKLDCTLYKYAVIGNHDEHDLDTYKNILDQANFKLLNNTAEYIFYKDIDPLKLIGITNDEDLANIFINEENINPQYTIVATNKPDNIDFIKNYNPNLIIAGNYLGGIINFPFYGALFPTKDAKIYHEDYYKFNDTEIYISNGIGNEKINFRLFNKPSINLYRLLQN